MNLLLESNEVKAGEIYRIIIPPHRRKGIEDYDIMVCMDADPITINTVKGHIQSQALAVYRATLEEKMYYHDIFEHTNLRDGINHIPIDQYYFKLWVEDRDLLLKMIKEAFDSTKGDFK